MEEDLTWMVVVRWPGGRENKPPAGEGYPHMHVTQSDATRLAGEMAAKLPPGCSTRYTAEQMPGYMLASGRYTTYSQSGAAPLTIDDLDRVLARAGLQYLR